MIAFMNPQRQKAPPVEEAMIRSVVCAAEPSGCFREGWEPLRIDQSIQLGHLRPPRSWITKALKIEKGTVQSCSKRPRSHLPYLWSSVNARIGAGRSQAAAPSAATLPARGDRASVAPGGSTPSGGNAMSGAEIHDATPRR